jgi:hypothetical protein
MPQVRKSRKEWKPLKEYRSIAKDDLDQIVDWLGKAGDIAVQFAPPQAAIPWSVIKSVMQVTSPLLPLNLTFQNLFSHSSCLWLTTPTRSSMLDSTDPDKAGDIAVQFAPPQAAIPWSVIKSVMQVTSPLLCLAFVSGPSRLSRADHADDFFSGRKQSSHLLAFDDRDLMPQVRKSRKRTFNLH